MSQYKWATLLPECRFGLLFTPPIAQLRAADRDLLVKLEAVHRGVRRGGTWRHFEVIWVPAPGEDEAFLDAQGYPWPRVTDPAAIEALWADPQYRPGLKVALRLCNPKGEPVPRSDPMTPLRAIPLDAAGKPDQAAADAAVAAFPWLVKQEELILGLPPNQFAGLVALGLAVAAGVYASCTGGGWRLRPQFQFLGGFQPRGAR